MNAADQFRLNVTAVMQSNAEAALVNKEEALRALEADLAMEHEKKIEALNIEWIKDMRAQVAASDRARDEAVEEVREECRHDIEREVASTAKDIQRVIEEGDVALKEARHSKLAELALAQAENDQKLALLQEEYEEKIVANELRIAEDSHGRYLESLRMTEEEARTRQGLVAERVMRWCEGLAMDKEREHAKEVDRVREETKAICRGKSMAVDARS